MTMRILHIDASPRASRSRSRVVAEAFLAGLPDDVQVTLWDVWQMDLPSLGGDMIEGRYELLFGRPVDDAVADEWQAVAKIAADFLAHDAFVISTPMWNFGVPYRLKHFVDVVTQPGMTFRNDAVGNVEGLAAGKRALVIGASAMPIGHDPSLDALDHQYAYLAAWLGFIGVDEIERIQVAPTFGPEDAVAETMAQSCEGAAALARRWALD
ncbi:FMN-dependent NADH-azoreductase [Erythrobacter sp. EC-HK427]|uniref:FMN-dependent NADH-azoreductase n=1 Tax=Erythrobacter sp. EC-HK427 TaxID=2038396 RepID=UPI00125B2DC2|nr:NAD(P)H-dependent oxidoreductase [Erythrobacter sp. EC-HK427]VVT00181.1 FMN-dependent NADH-azoreductase [Erythrobacter sp. EC-HK427]